MRHTQMVLHVSWALVRGLQMRVELTEEFLQWFAAHIGQHIETTSAVEQGGYFYVMKYKQEATVTLLAVFNLHGLSSISDNWMEHSKLYALFYDLFWPLIASLLKARYGGSNMKKINNGGRLLIFYMMEGIKKVNWKNGILWLFSVTDPPKIQDGRQI